MLSSATKSLPRGFSMPPITHITELNASLKLRDLANDCFLANPYSAYMDQDHTHYLREWRKYRKMTQGALAELIDTSVSVISDLERDVLQLSPKWLRRLAPALGTQPGHILDVNPLEADADIIDIWSRIPDTDRQQAIRTLQSFTKTGTE